MYLSCLDINTDNPIVRRWVGSPYRIHQRLYLAFAADARGDRLLFRVEEIESVTRVIVQAQAKADWHSGFADLPALHGNPVQKEITYHFQIGQVLRFLLRANPTKRLAGTRDTGSTGGMRLGLLGEDEQRSWLERKGQTGGFRPMAYEVHSDGLSTFRRGQVNPITQTHAVAIFEGRLVVTDPDRLLTVVRDGVGAGKAFGFGLLSLARG